MALGAWHFESPWVTRRKHAKPCAYRRQNGVLVVYSSLGWQFCLLGLVWKLGGMHLATALQIIWRRKELHTSAHTRGLCSLSRGSHDSIAHKRIYSLATCCWGICQFLCSRLVNAIIILRRFSRKLVDAYKMAFPSCSRRLFVPARVHKEAALNLRGLNASHQVLVWQ